MPDKTVWVVRAGRGGAYASLFEKNGLVAVGLPGVDEDVSAWPRDQLVERVIDAMDEPRERAHGYASMLARLVYEVQIGDVIVMPDTPNGEVVVGEISGKYKHLPRSAAPGFEHARPVTWRRRLRWDALPVQVRRSISAPMAVFKPGAQEAVLGAVDHAE